MNPSFTVLLLLLLLVCVRINSVCYLFPARVRAEKKTESPLPYWQLLQLLFKCIFRSLTFLLLIEIESNSIGHVCPNQFPESRKLT